MVQSGSIENLQKVTIPALASSKCVHSDLTLFEKQEQASPLSLILVLSDQENYRINQYGFKLKGKHE